MGHVYGSAICEQHAVGPGAASPPPPSREREGLMTHDTIAAAVRSEVERRGMTQRQLSDLTGIGQGRISEWLVGKRQMRTGNASIILVALGLEVRRARRSPTRAGSR